PGAPDYEQWMAGERERLRHAMLSALLSLAAWHIQQHDMVASLEQLTRLLAIDPASEVGHRQKMVVLARMGLRSTALQQYETCRRVLAEELDVAPSPETMAVYELILSGAMGPQTAAGTETV
ncbi:MAG: bacterial transcriptional activator domain-containing protein, partial [Anaerolineae bacterium]|nr:bacterial transcriptional activator domain-containing protein [Anaerolineae bacterium]